MSIRPFGPWRRSYNVRVCFVKWGSSNISRNHLRKRPVRRKKPLHVSVSSPVKKLIETANSKTNMGWAGQCIFPVVVSVVDDDAGRKSALSGSVLSLIAAAIYLCWIFSVIYPWLGVYTGQGELDIWCSFQLIGLLTQMVCNSPDIRLRGLCSTDICLCSLDQDWAGPLT